MFFSIICKAFTVPEMIIRCMGVNKEILRILLDVLKHNEYDIVSHCLCRISSKNGPKWYVFFLRVQSISTWQTFSPLISSTWSQAVSRWITSSLSSQWTWYFSSYWEHAYNKINKQYWGSWGFNNSSWICKFYDSNVAYEEHPDKRLHSFVVYFEEIAGKEHLSSSPFHQADWNCYQKVIEPLEWSACRSIHLAS